METNAAGATMNNKRHFHSVSNSPCPTKQAQSAQIAEHVAAFERLNGPIKTLDIEPRDGKLPKHGGRVDITVGKKRG
jgi:hypothetical protein